MPFGTGAGDLQLSIEGDRLDRVSRLVGLDLPALGPYGLDTRWVFDESGNQLSDLRVRLGDAQPPGAVPVR